MQGLTVAVLALCAAWAQARLVVLSAEEVFHTDKWCADHHLGEGPTSCVEHKGCCYDGRIGICHSCDAHSDEWCSTYGGTDVAVCTGFSGCTMEYADNEDGSAGHEGVCVSTVDPADMGSDEVTCMEAFEAAVAPAQSGAATADIIDADFPECDADGLWEPVQETAVEGKTWVENWCADENGHEIPDTRMSSPEFEKKLINCKKERHMHAGLQCPNAVTLATGNGEIMINDHEDVGNCDVTCNTDHDCKADAWCCYNGCGYSCQVPILPKADCQHLVLDASLKASELSENKHGTEVTISCNDGYTGKDGSAPSVDIECKHGSWSDYKITCFESCTPFRVPAPLRTRDYVISGKGLVHGSKRKVKCANGYGAVSGSADAMRFYKETIHCINGAWEVLASGTGGDSGRPAAYLGEMSLVCSACFDAPASGPHAFETSVLADGSAAGNAGGGDGHDCQHFASRPMECAQYPEAVENCRVSCRSCEAALMEYKVKAVIEDKGATKHPSKWLKKKLSVLVSFQNWITEDVRTKVAKRVRKDDGTQLGDNLDPADFGGRRAGKAKAKPAAVANEAK